jgi:hypothetical protein
MIMRFLLSLSLAALSCLWQPAPLQAQSVSGLGAISGTVLDATGSAVADALVQVTNETLGIRRELTTSSAGIFNALSLTPAVNYRVTVTKPGFASYEVSGVQVVVGQIANVRVRLEVAQAQQTIDVVAEALSADQTKTGVSDVVNSNQILNLPINGRRVDSFVLLTPAVVPEGNFGLLSFRGIPGGNAFLIDGNDTTNQLWNENAGRTRIASNISQDAVQEFQVLSSSYSAEFGRAVGGVVNTVTRSGDNELHGTGFWFFRNQDFNALDRYAKALGQPKPDERRQQFGGAAGGPIVRNRLFYFGNAEFTRRDFPIVSSLNTPPLFDAQGAFVGQCAAPATPQQCQTAIAFVSRFNRIVPRTANNNLGFGKLDYRPADRNSFSFSFNLLNWASPNGIQTGAVLNNGAALGSNGISTVKTRYGRAAWTSILRPNLVNEARFGWMKDRLFDDVNPDLLPPTGTVTISVQGVSNLGGANYLPRVFPTEDRFQFADTLSWTQGKHLVKVGFDFSHVRDVQDQVFNGNGSYTYANFTNFALDLSGNAAGAKRWQSYAQGFGPPKVNTWIRDYIGFVQDQFRVTPRLTLNLGLRLEAARYAQPATPNPDYRETGRIPEQGLNAAPRFGIAWSPWGNRTVIRGGYGLFYARIPGGLVNWLHRDNSNFQFTINLQGNVPQDLEIGPVFPNRLPDTGRRPAPGTTSITIAGDDFRIPYTQQADIGVERQLMRDTLLSVSYIWSRGLAFTTIRDANIGPLGPAVTYRINDAAGNQVGSYSTATYLRANRVDPRYQRVGVLEPNGNTYYNAMAVQLRSKQSKWLETQLSYTWSHALDYNLGVTGDNLFFGNVPRTVFNGDFRNEKGTSEIDQRHRLVVNFVSNLAFGIKPRFWRVAVDNWQLSGIYNYASGPYATPVVFVSGTPFSGAAFNNTLNGLGGSTRAPFLPRTSLRVDDINRADFRLSKVFAITEGVGMMFLFEAFNVTNSQFDTGVRTQAYQAVSGVLNVTPRLGEGTQSAGFPDGTNARRAQIGLRLMF